MYLVHLSNELRPAAPCDPGTGSLKRKTDLSGIDSIFRQIVFTGCKGVINFCLPRKARTAPPGVTYSKGRAAIKASDEQGGKNR